MGEPLVSAWLCRGSPPAPPYSRGDKPKGKSMRFLNPGRCPVAPRHPQSYDGGQWVPPRAQGGWERGWLGAGRVKCAQPGGTGIKGPVVPGAGSAPQGLLREPCAASWGLPVPPPRPWPPQLPTGLSQGQHLPAPDVTGQAGMESPHVPARPCSAHRRCWSCPFPRERAVGSRAAPTPLFLGVHPHPVGVSTASRCLEQLCSEGRNVGRHIHHPKEHQQRTQHPRAVP